METSAGLFFVSEMVRRLAPFFPGARCRSRTFQKGAVEIASAFSCTDCRHQLAQTALAAADILAGKMPGTYKATVSFGEYGAPDFDSRVKTLSSAATGGIMSVQAQVDELWGSSKDDDWKAAEVRRILNERGIAELEEPSLGGDSLK